MAANLRVSCFLQNFIVNSFSGTTSNKINQQWLQFILYKINMLCTSNSDLRQFLEPSNIVLQNRPLDHTKEQFCLKYYFPLCMCHIRHYSNTDNTLTLIKINPTFKRTQLFSKNKVPRGEYEKEINKNIPSNAMMDVRHLSECDIADRVRLYCVYRAFCCGQ